jgi:predicted RNA binding protein YcfA (HicA-like mRNA interferase family)
MGNIKAYSGNEILSKLKNAGFEIIRIRGSHHFLKHPDGRSTVVPVHSNENIGIGLFMKILKDVEINKNEFVDL